MKDFSRPPVRSLCLSARVDGGKPALLPLFDHVQGVVWPDMIFAVLPAGSAVAGDAKAEGPTPGAEPIVPACPEVGGPFLEPAFRIVGGPPCVPPCPGPEEAEDLCRRILMGAVLEAHYACPEGSHVRGQHAPFRLSG